LLKARVQSCLLLDQNGAVRSSMQPNSPDIILDLAERLKNNSIKFPVMPDIAIQVDKLFKESPDVSITDLSDIIKADPALTMRLISISNSAHYRGATSIENLEEAIMRLGMKETQNYLLLLATRTMFESENPSFKKLLEGLWVHSLATAEAARLLGKLIKYPDLNLLFTLGMLHDMGKLLLLQILLELDKNGRDMDEANIIEIIDTLHMAFGASLMRKWNMPSEFSYTTEQHHTIAEGANYSQQFLIVCLANLITRKPGYSLKEDNDDDPSQTYPARMLGIDADAISMVTEELVPFINSIKGLS
jgi:HD-like signal output (HDOD) protein